MKKICFTFQVHQPYRLSNFHFFDIGSHSNYFDDDTNSKIMHTVAEKSYLPTNQLLINLINTHGNRIKVNFAISGTALDQMEQYEPKILESFIQLAKTGNVEFLGQTYSNSLSSLKSKTAFKDEVLAHKFRIESLFGQTPKVFFNTGLIYSNSIARLVSELGFKAIIIDGIAHVLKEKSCNILYESNQIPSLKLLLRNQSLTNDIALRFSWKDWSEWPLTADKYMKWLRALNAQDKLVNIVLDYATFGEHCSNETGIFSFLEYLLSYIAASKDFKLSTTHDVIKSVAPTSKLNIQKPISWSGTENSLSTWLENDMQKEAIQRLYSLEKAVKKTKDEMLLNCFLYLQSADHFLYMDDTDSQNTVSLSPYENPYDAFLRYMNVLSDFELKIHDKLKKSTKNSHNV